jgi:RNA recognition motif-containing protein
MPYAATDTDLRAHFTTVGEPSQVVIPVDRETGRPRGFAFVEFAERAVAEEAITRFNQHDFMGRSLSVSEARPREARSSAPRPGGFGGPPRFGGGGGAPPAGRFGPGPPRTEGPGGRTFGPPKKKSTPADRRWESKERGPRGPIKERFSGRLGSLYDGPDEKDDAPIADFDDPARRADPSPDLEPAESDAPATDGGDTLTAAVGDATSEPAAGETDAEDGNDKE